MHRRDICALFLSKNRPMQLQACMESVSTNLPEVKNYYILLNTENNEKRYQQVFDAFPNKHKTITIEKSFEMDFKSLLEEISWDFKYVVALTDDTIVYRALTDLDMNLPQLFSPLEVSDVFTVSLRLGKNVIVQDIDNPRKHILNVPPDFFTVRSNFNGYLWDWQKQSLELNTGYPISLDGHIYRTKELSDLTNSIQFNNLREWEGRLIDKTVGNKDVPRLMACPPYSLCVNIPYHMIQSPNYKEIGPFGTTPEKFNGLFDKNYRMDLEKMFQEEPSGSHWYIKPEYKRI